MSATESKINSDYLNKDLDPRFNANNLSSTLREYWDLVNPHNRALANEIFQFEKEGKVSSEFQQKLIEVFTKNCDYIKLGTVEEVARQAAVSDLRTKGGIPGMLEYLEHPRIIYKIRNGLLTVETATKFLREILLQGNQFKVDIIEAGLTQDEFQIMLRTCSMMNHICFELLKQGYNFEQVFALTESQKNMLHDKIPLGFVLEHNTLFYLSGTISALSFQGKDNSFALQSLHKLSQFARPNPSWGHEVNRQDINEIPANILDFLKSPRGRMYVNDDTFSLDEVCTQLTTPDIRLLSAQVRALVTQVGILPRELDDGWITLLAAKPKSSETVFGENKGQAEDLCKRLLVLTNQMKAIETLEAPKASESIDKGVDLGVAATTPLVAATTPLEVQAPDKNSSGSTLSPRV